MKQAKAACMLTSIREHRGRTQHPNEVHDYDLQQTDHADEVSITDATAASRSRAVMVCRRRKRRIMTCTIDPAMVATNCHVGRSGFRSFKTAGPIHYPQRWQRDFLVQSTLDPAIDAIQALPEVDLELFGVLMRFAGVERRVLVARDEQASSLVSRAAVVVPRSYVLAEPRCSTARMVWSARKTLVSARIRLRTVSELRRNPQGIAIGLLSDALSACTPDPTDAILALVCAGQIEIDLGHGFSPDTLVRHRSAQERTPPMSTGFASFPI